jgi:dienelactone hydrolase/predicted Ser/Thr protein kinase
MKCPECQTDISGDSRFCGKCGTPVQAAERAVFSRTRTILKPREEVAPETLLAGKYKVIRVAGRGGMGIVYKAEDTKLKRHVALKFLPQELVLSPEARERFVVEARAAAALSHPNICTIYEIHDEGEKPFIAMEYIEGETLKAKIAKGALDAAAAVDLALQLADGLGEAHKKGVVHRDIKSANVMVTDKGRAKIMDFGLAKVKGGTLLTREGTTLGTVAYMSPEQALGKDIDHRTDIWSLGVVLYEMLSGRLPFHGDHEASILYAVVHEEPAPLKAAGPGAAPVPRQAVARALKKDREARYASAEEFAKDLRQFKDSLRPDTAKAFSPRALLRTLRRPAVAVPAAVAVAAFALAAAWHLDRQAKVRWAREVALPEAQALARSGFMRLPEAYRLLERAEKYIPGAPELADLFKKCSVAMTVTTTPEGARVYMKSYAAPDGEWEFLGLSPLIDVRVPIQFCRWKLEKEGFETVTAVQPTVLIDMAARTLFLPGRLERALDEEGGLPEGMLRVPPVETREGSIPGFFIDRFEVTNKKFKEFMDRGGYRDRTFWKEKFVKDGRELSWEEALSLFVDRSGQPGPAGWQAGDFPPGQADHPVSGISWYEAAAYAESAGKSLPTVLHWLIASGQRSRSFVPEAFSALLSVQSNFSGTGPVPVGRYAGMTEYGALDMAGNVSEWCSNETPLGRVLRGGAWNDATYLFGNTSQAPAFDRSEKNGFRCVLYPDPAGVPAAAFQPAVVGEARDFAKEGIVPDSVFQVYREQFSYDPIDLKAASESRTEDPQGWIQEKVSFDAAYGGERVVAYLFLPKKAAPPFQTVVYFPSSSSAVQPSSEDIGHYREFENSLSYLVKNGRAVLYPVYKGTFERGSAELASIHDGRTTHQYTELIVQIVKDFKRSIDYLETRPEIDARKLAYLGLSWGGRLGPLVAAVEDRVKTAILLVGGMRGEGRPEASPVSYVRRVKVPVLMLNGKYDFTFPFDTMVKPLFDLLGTPPGQKELKLYESGHFVPPNEMIKEVLAWLDKHLGPVR